MIKYFANISAKTRIQWSQVLWILVFWVILGGLLGLYKTVNYDPVSQQFVFIAPQGYTIGQFLLINLIGPFIAGITGGTFIVFVLKEKLRTKSYFSFISIMGAAFFFIILLLNTLISFVFYYSGHQDTDQSFLAVFISQFLLDPYALRNIITWLLVGFATVTMLQVSDKYGPGVFAKFLIGKYYHPKEEERIFMFLDLNNSTQLAEKLGNIRFFTMLSSFYTDITDSILESQGEIYQYVGDEIVVTWTLNEGLKNANCLHCFFKIEQAILDKADHYQHSYGVTPTFMAGMHMGKVIVGEIGLIKKDIVYSGDVLNTSARVLEVGKKTGQDLVITQPLFQPLQQEKDAFNYTAMGQVPLRGKGTHLELWAVSLKLS